MSHISSFFERMPKCSRQKPENRNDVAQLKFFSKTYIGTSVYMHHRPRGNHHADWGAERIKKYDQKFYTGNFCTDEHKMYLAAKFGIKDEWEKKIETYNADTPITQKNWDFIYMKATVGNHANFVLGMDEGMHRLGASIELTLGSPISDDTSDIQGPGRLNYDEYVRTDLISDDDVLKLKDEPDKKQTFQEELEEILQNRKESTFFTKIPTVKISFITASQDEEPIEKILRQRRIVSEQRSNNKRTSNSRDAYTRIGELGKNFIRRVDQINFERRPDTTGALFGSIAWKSKAEAVKLMDTAAKTAVLDFDDMVGQEKEAFEFNEGGNEFFFHETWVNYCKDPNNHEYYNAVVKHFTFQEKLDTTESSPAAQQSLQPPFIHTLESLAQDKKSSKYLTTYEINLLLFFPPVMHLLYADRVNKPVKEMKNEQKLHELCLFASRYQLFQVGFVRTRLHGIIDRMNYPSLNFSPFTTNKPNDIIGCAMTIADMLNTSFVHPKEFGESVKNYDQYCDVMGNQFDGAFAQLGSRHGTLKIEDFIACFGKKACQIPLYSKCHGLPYSPVFACVLSCFFFRLRVSSCGYV